MGFAAEPYRVFVDDLLTGLTGGVTREQFTFLDEQQPFKLGHGDVLEGTVRIHGLVAGDFHQFDGRTDFEVVDGVIAWRADRARQPAAGATWPDEGSRFYASYERIPDAQAPPVLTDRNPGSVVRTLAESFAREFAVLSRQLELVYESAYLDTATGGDLDRVVALVGIERRRDVVAAGQVEFSRSTPAPADVFIPEGTLVSTSDVPAITVETTEARTLRRGTASVSAPVRALVEGASGVAGAGTLTVIHRPMLGIEAATNPEALAFGGGEETDAALRRRAERALEVSGRATPGAIVGALASVAGIRAQDVRIEEDHNLFPGVVKVTVAADFAPDDPRGIRAAELLDEYRPAGIRVLHNLPVPPAPESPSSPGEGGEEGVAVTGGLPDGAFSPIVVDAVVTPASTTLGADAKRELVAKVRAAISAHVADLGIGDMVVFNALVADIMVLDGVFDVSLEIAAKGADDVHRRRNIAAVPPTSRPRLAPDDLRVDLRGEEIALAVAATVERRGLAATDPPAAALARIHDSIDLRLRAFVRSLAEGEAVTPASLLAILTPTDEYKVEAISYNTEFVAEGLRVVGHDREIVPTAGQVVAIRTVQVTEAAS
jgi:uncharacterized phage protein gp47/JayE